MVHLFVELYMFVLSFCKTFNLFFSFAVLMSPISCMFHWSDVYFIYTGNQ